MSSSARTEHGRKKPKLRKTAPPPVPSPSVSKTGHSAPRSGTLAEAAREASQMRLRESPPPASPPQKAPTDQGNLLGRAEPTSALSQKGYSVKQQSVQFSKTAESSGEVAHPPAPDRTVFDPALWIALAPKRASTVCTHPPAEELEHMLRVDGQSPETDERLQKARMCESCQLTLAIIARYTGLSAFG